MRGSAGTWRFCAFPLVDVLDWLLGSPGRDRGPTHRRIDSLILLPSATRCLTIGVTERREERDDEVGEQASTRFECSTMHQSRVHLAYQEGAYTMRR